MMLAQSPQKHLYLGLWEPSSPTWEVEFIAPLFILRLAQTAAM